jgi:hypothetical protein
VQPFTPAEAALFTGPSLETSFGVELLDPSLKLISDISADVAADGAKVSRNSLADIHATCELTISRTLAWGYDRLRPYTVVNGVRKNQGVYVPTSPEREIGETPESHAVVGYDQMMLLGSTTGDTYAVQVGYPVLASVRGFVAAAGVLAPVLLDSTAEGAVLVTEMIWPTTSSEAPTWLGICNDLLAAVGYRGLWADWNGNLRSGPYVLPELRASEFRLDVGNLKEGIVSEPRKVANDVFGLPNWMRVVRNGMTTAPVELNGWHTMANSVNGPSSFASLGRWVRAPAVYLDAVSQADLVTQGERLFAAATRASEVLTFQTSFLPYWHADVLTYADAALGTDRKVLVRSWVLPLAGGDMDVVAETIL